MIETPKETEKNLCPMAITLVIIGGKWKLNILHFIAKGVHRPSDIERNIKNISRRVLSKQIQELLADGVIYKHVHSVIPPKVEYFLTDLGKEICPVLEVMEKWGINYLLKNPKVAERC
jgi:DNA-binding HxlR family transcriptional regulator